MWLYFGCGPHDKGHYIYTENGQKLYNYGTGGPNYRELTLDGILAPQPEMQSNLYQATFNRLEGWGMSALAWWDRSADTRGKSNSVIYAPSLIINAADMLDEAMTRFPWVFSRLPQSLQRWSAP